MNTTFSAQLQKLRKEHGVTQDTLAAHLGVSPQAVSKWENGSIINEDNKSDSIYRTSSVLAVAPIMIMICADMMISSPSSYQNQIVWNDEAWFKREDFSFLKKTNDTGTYD